MAGNDIDARSEAAARLLVERLTEQHGKLVLAESCTAGLVSALLARTSGASAVLWGAFVCYSAEAKERMLGMDGDFLRRHGQVSRETARAMAMRALTIADASIAAAVTGLAGPLADGSDTPVGTVWVAVARQTGCGTTAGTEKELFFQGNRAEVRMQAAAAVLEALLEAAPETGVWGA